MLGFAITTLTNLRLSLNDIVWRITMYKNTHLGRLFFLISLFMILNHVAHADSAIILDKEMNYPDAAWNPDYKVYLQHEPGWARDDWKQSIVIPMPPNLEDTAKEIEAINKLRPLREKHQADIDREIELEGIYERFYTVLNASPATHPVMAEFMGNVFYDATRVVFYFKNHFNRARPYHYYPEIKATIDPPEHPSYPSGHAAQAYSIALALAEVFPNRRTDLISVAYKISTNREIGGVHYESDTEAGKTTAMQLVAQMKENSGFRDWVNRVAQESIVE